MTLCHTILKNNLRVKSLLGLLLLTANLCAQELSFDQGNIKGENYYEEINFEIVYDKIIIPESEVKILPVVLEETAEIKDFRGEFY